MDKAISEEDAEGALARQYAAAVGRSGAVAGIVKLHGNHLATLRASMNLCMATRRHRTTRYRDGPQ